MIDLLLNQVDFEILSTIAICKYSRYIIYLSMSMYGLNGSILKFKSNSKEKLGWELTMQFWFNKKKSMYSRIALGVILIKLSLFSSTINCLGKLDLQSVKVRVTIINWLWVLLLI